MAHFPIFLVKKFFFKKSGSVKHKKTWALNTMLSFRIKLMSQSRKNFRTEGQTDPNSQNPSDHGRGSNIVRHFLVSRTSALYGLWNPKFTQTYLNWRLLRIPRVIRKQWDQLIPLASGNEEDLQSNSQKLFIKQTSPGVLL